MTGASLQSSRACHSAISAAGFVWSRTRATGSTLKTETTGLRSQSSRVSAAFQSTVGLSPASWIAALSSLGSVLAARSLSKPQCARFWPLLNLCRRLAGSSFLPRFKFCQEPSRGIFEAFSLSPINLSLLVAAHVVSSSSGAKDCPTKEFPKPENKFPRIA